MRRKVGWQVMDFFHNPELNDRFIKRAKNAAGKKDVVQRVLKMIPRIVKKELVDLLSHCRKYRSDIEILVVPHYKNYRHPIIIFQGAYADKYTQTNGQQERWQINKPVLYNNRFYTAKEIFGFHYCPFGCATCDIKITQIPYHQYFLSQLDNTADGFSQHRRDVLQPIKDLLKKQGVIEETRGKIKKKDEIKVNRDRFIINQFKEITKKTNRKRPLPIAIIQKRWTAKINSMFPDDPEKAEGYYCSDTIIRRAIKSYTKK